MRPSRVLLLWLILATFAAPGQAQSPEAGRTTSVTGVVSLQRADGSVALAGQGSAVRVGDTVVTQPESRAVVELRDGARLTVRPGSEFRIEGYRFQQDRPEEDSTVIRLLRGGLRTLSGLLGQRRPSAFRLDTATATIGIRGTDFIARVCQEDCGQEVRKELRTAVPRTPGYVARVFAVQGRLVTTAGPRAGKPLATGDPVYGEDILESGDKAFGVLVFQDGTRVVLQENSRFSVERYKYEPARPEDGNVALRLLRGGLRVLSGAVARSNNRQFKVGTVVATLGVRGTGFDMLCYTACAVDGAAGPPGVPDGLTVRTWQGVNVVTNGAGTQEISEGQALNVAAADQAPRRLEAVPPIFDQLDGPRPDRLKVDARELFGLQREDFAEPGIYVQVREGGVTLRGAGNEVFLLSRGEVGYLDATGNRFERLGVTPSFLDRDIFMRDGEPSDYGCFMR